MFDLKTNHVKHLSLPFNFVLHVLNIDPEMKLRIDIVEQHL